MEGFIKKYKRSKRKDYQRLKIVEELEHKVVQLERKIKLLQRRIRQLDNKNIQLKNVNSKCNGLFATFMFKCVIEAKYPVDSKGALDRIYLLSREMLKEIKRYE